nr:MAG TPA: hypothetical protein [Caudoviricetes sp.]
MGLASPLTMTRKKSSLFTLMVTVSSPSSVSLVSGKTSSRLT